MIQVNATVEELMKAQTMINERHERYVEAAGSG